MWMSEAVTPGAGDPDGVPFLQTTPLVPKAPVALVVLAAVVDDVPPSPAPFELLLRPHAAITNAMTQMNANQPKRFTSPPIGRTRDPCSTNLTTRQVARQCPLRACNASMGME